MSLTVANYGVMGCSASSNLDVVSRKHLQNNGGQPPRIATGGFFTSVKTISPMASVARLYNTREGKACRHLPLLMFSSVSPPVGARNSADGVFSTLTTEFVMSNALLSIQDLNTTINHEPRIQDLKIAKALGFKQPRMIRKLIARYESELQSLGTCSTVERVIRGNVAKEYYLNKKQSLFICTKSETEKATEVTIAMVEIFDSYLKGELQPTTITAEMQNTLQQIIKNKAGVENKKIVGIWSRFNNHFKLGSYKQLPATRFNEAIEYLNQMPVNGQPLLTQESADELIEATKRQMTSATVEFLDSVCNDLITIANRAEEIDILDDSRPARRIMKRLLKDIEASAETSRKKIAEQIFPDAPKELQDRMGTTLLSALSKMPMNGYDTK